MAASFSCSFVGPSSPEPQLSLPMSSEVLRLEPPTWLDAGRTSVSAKLRARSRALQARFSGGGGARGRSCAACTNRYTVHVRVAAGFQRPTVSMLCKLSLFLHQFICPHLYLRLVGSISCPLVHCRTCPSGSKVNRMAAGCAEMTVMQFAR